MPQSWPTINGNDSKPFCLKTHPFQGGVCSPAPANSGFFVASARPPAEKKTAIFSLTTKIRRPNANYSTTKTRKNAKKQGVDHLERGAAEDAKFIRIIMKNTFCSRLQYSFWFYFKSMLYEFLPTIPESVILAGKLFRSFRSLYNDPPSVPDSLIRTVYWRVTVLLTLCW